MTFHMTQVAHHLYNPGGDQRSENCGPASLAMGLRRLGLRPPSLPDRATGRTLPSRLPTNCGVQDWIDAVRYAMFSDSLGRSLNSDKDGVDWTTTGRRRVAAKHLTLVGLDDLLRGAANCGALGHPLTCLEDVRQALVQETPVLLVGDPSASGAHGSRLGVDYRGGHAILAVAYDGRFRVHDPLCLDGPAWLTGTEVRAFCGAAIFGNQWGLALTRAQQSLTPGTL